MSGKQGSLGDEIRGDFGDGPRDYALCLMLTPSMTPAISRGDLLLVERGAARLVPGDVLMLRAERADLLSFAHRLIRVEGRGERRVVWLKGDHELHYDAPAPVASVIGRAAFVRRADGRWFSLNQGSVRAAGRVAAAAFRALLAVIEEKERPDRRTKALRAANDLVARWYARRLERAPARQLNGTPAAR